MINAGTKDWEVTEFPDFSGMSCYVLGGAFHAQIVSMLAKAGFKGSATINDADVVVFAGGSDINPALYKQKAIPGTHFNQNRDIMEEAVYRQCIKRNIPMFGICRGAQFLHAMNGGELWQDVNNHAGRDHWIVDIEDDVRVKVTSIHHQMLKDNDELCVIAVCEDQIATSFKDENLHIQLKEDSNETVMEVEAGAYIDTGCFFVQGHPEIGSPAYAAWTMRKLYDFLTEFKTANTGPTKEELGIIPVDQVTEETA